MFKTLCLSGGGSLGFAHAGALKYLNDNKLLNHVDTVIGTSVGSIVAVLFAIGVSPEKMLEEFMDADQNMILALLEIEKFFSHYGVDNGEYMIAFVSDIIRKHNVDPRISFKQILKKFRKRVVIVGSNVSKACVEYFGPETHGDLRVLDAVRISISIPFWFSRVKVNSDLYVDGSLTDHYPLHWALEDFRKRHPFDDHQVGVVGILLRSVSSREITSLQEYLANLFTTMVSKGIYNSCTIDIRCDGGNSLNFDMSKDERKSLYDRGYQEAKRYIRQLQNHFKKTVQRRRSV